ncbi:hypothetical protein FHT21_004869 [Pedobacter sp. SG908]|nr:hypothetical protein [Pedobacter sp. SG908]
MDGRLVSSQLKIFNLQLILKLHKKSHKINLMGFFMFFKFTLRAERHTLCLEGISKT